MIKKAVGYSVASAFGAFVGVVSTFSLLAYISSSDNKKLAPVLDIRPEDAKVGQVHFSAQTTDDLV